MMKLDGDLEDIPRHKEFLKFFKALFIFYFSKGEAMTFFFFSRKKDLKQSLNLQISLCEASFDMENFKREPFNVRQAKNIYSNRYENIKLARQHLNAKLQTQLMNTSTFLKSPKKFCYKIHKNEKYHLLK